MGGAPIVTLLTDFGDEDGFVGAMRGVILSRAPGVRLVDLAHHVARGDVAKGGRVLARSAPFFPAGTVHCAVVDPGVGSARRAVAVAAGGMVFVAPDNGLLTEVLAGIGGAEARLVEDPRAMRGEVSRTFHGRDVFAPAAAALAAGLPFADIGRRVADLVRLDRQAPRREGAVWRGRVVEVDRFGNLITDVPADGLPARVEIDLDGLRLSGPSASYAAVEPGAPVLVVGSLGTLEVAVRDGSAAERFGLAAGAACTVRPGGRQSGA